MNSLDDKNRVRTMVLQSSTDATVSIRALANPVTGALLIEVSDNAITPASIPNNALQDENRVATVVCRDSTDPSKVVPLFARNGNLLISI